MFSPNTKSAPAAARAGHRRGVEAPATGTLAALGKPILRTIHGAGLMEGGSFAFIRPDVAVVGISSRVNEEGAPQLEEVLATQGRRLIRVQIPSYLLHIDGAFVTVHHDVAIVNPATLPFVFTEELRRLAIRMVPMSHEDPSWAVNCLAVAPGCVLMSDQVSPRQPRQHNSLPESLAMRPRQPHPPVRTFVPCGTPPAPSAAF